MIQNIYFKKYNETVRSIIKQSGGYIAQEEQNIADEKSENTNLLNLGKPMLM